MQNKAIVLLSGGLDSTTLLYHLLHKGHEVHALSIYYGQRHEIELRSAEAISSVAGVPYTHIEVDSRVYLNAKSSQVGTFEEVPSGHYEDVSMKVTVVPNRNMLLLAHAVAFALSNSAQTVAYAAHAGDHAIYPDCRPEFMTAMQRVINLCDYSEIELYAPFKHCSKAEIVQMGSELNVPFHLTWSCYNPNTDNPNIRAQHCGKCGTCMERKEAFALSGVFDPTQYGA